MNNGFFGFPVDTSIDLSGSSPVTDIVTFDTTGRYYIKPKTKGLIIYSVSGGAGGGGGARQATSTNAYGGGGGGGGEAMFRYFPVEDLGGVGAMLTITIGAGGTGGNAAATDSSNGSGGTSAGTNTIAIRNGRLYTSPITLHSHDFAGFAGSGGTTTSGSAGTGNRYHTEKYLFPSSHYFSTPTSSGVDNTINHLHHCGGAGGGRHLLGVTTNGGSQVIGTASTTFCLKFDRGSTAYAGGVANSGVAPSDVTEQIHGIFSSGFGGAGGAPGTTTAATKGGNGWRGGGGGGGGGSANGFAAGAGGNGGNGFVAIKPIYN